MADNYDFDVFINCPFDDQYAPLFDAMLFAVYSCGFRPRCTKEFLDAGSTRIEKIYSIISECKFGIHDISRTELDKDSSLPRFNMPLELGLFLGAKRFGSINQQKKVALVFDIEKYRYQKFISDIAGQDIESHGNCPSEIIKKTRQCLNSSSVKGRLPSASSIIKSYENYERNLPGTIEKLGFQAKDVEYRDKTQFIEQWLKMTGRGE